MVLEARGLKPVPLSQNQDVGGAVLPLFGNSRGESVPCFILLLLTAHIPWLVAPLFRFLSLRSDAFSAVRAPCLPMPPSCKNACNCN